MYVAYLRADENYRPDAPPHYEIMARRSGIHLSLLFSNESVWIVPGTVSTDD